jgi:hypothetical protein
MQITTQHPASEYGVPVILDDAGGVMDPAPGLAAALARLGWSRATLAERTGYSRRTVEGWFVGRPVPASALNVLADALRKEGG